jgi:phospholipid/cholesterol/gamma-HCH transport system substrate-binding protein
VELDGWQARVRLRIGNKVKLPRNAVAELGMTSMLGEKYVSLAAPTDGEEVGRLADGAKIPLSRSGRNPEIEEVLSALSALLNGGGVAQLRTINQELNKALHGRENRVKSLLTQLDTFIGGLDAQRGEIIRALEGVDRLAKRLRKEKTAIGQAVDTMPGALKVLADQRSNLTRMLGSLSKLGNVGSKVINASKADTVANLQHLQPILHQLNKAGSDLPNALELMTSYPFPRNVTGAIKGDYTNLKITADLDLKSIYGNNTGGGGGDSEKPRKPGEEKPELPGLPDDPTKPEDPKDPEAPELPDVPGVTQSSLHGGDAFSGGSRYPSGVSIALADLMTRGMQP